ncbi:nitronate monooxygenase [Shouchella miscanthi]|uniref:Probable nitronate monooxygenase n=1 Tax=Shouchella miscanthi TaxID=2598861 RepID=A0ABU6NJZ0_9BACI|nr:nitronate monooxygenase [Shouchella miscanthi]
MITERLNIQYPIIQGGMGNSSDPILAASISEAGGLGTIGCGTDSADTVREKIKETKRRTAIPFSLNIPLSMNEEKEQLLALAIDERIPIVSLSAGNPKAYIPVLKRHGIIVLCVVASLKQAIKAEAAGADILVVEGFEAAGINASTEMTTLTLVPLICERVGIPVVAAGGIADGRGLAAVVMLGAAGIQMGTRFIATKEAPYSTKYKEKLLLAADDATVIVGRSHGQVRRILKGSYAERLLQNESRLSLHHYKQWTSEEIHRIGAMEGDDDRGFMNGGQIAGIINDLPSVQDLLHQVMKEAQETMRVKQSWFDAFSVN